MAESLHRGDDDGHVLRAAASHDGVDGDLVGHDDLIAAGDLADDFVPAKAAGGQHRLHRGVGGRDDGQPIGPAGVVIPLDELARVVDGGGDLAFKRYAIVAGPGAGLLDLGEARFDDVKTVPAGGYRGNEGAAEPRNPAIAAWYRYGFFTHVLTPKPHVWAVRTAEARYAKLEMVGYYCPGPEPGCPTFRYVYQGDGTTRVAP